MRCPVCSSQLKKVVSKTAVVDVCPGCRGIWFDADELADFVKFLSLREDITPDKIKLFKRRKVKSKYRLKEKAKHCPRCKKKLQKFNYSYDSNVFLEKCNNCGGIWADGGEVVALASYLKEDPRSTAFAKVLTESMSELQVEPQESLARYFLFVPYFVIPISDDTPRQKFPVVTVSLIAICVLTFFGQLSLSTDIEHFIKEFGFVPARFFSVGLITSMFLHAGILHLIFNMLFWWLFGDNVEDRFTRGGYLVFCLGCGLFANFLHGIFNLGSTMPVIGASGMISGVMGAYLIFYPQANVTVWCFNRTFEVSVILFLVGWFVIQMVSAFEYRDSDISRVAWLAHIGGFVFGVVVAFFKKIAKQAGTAYK